MRGRWIGRLGRSRSPMTAHKNHTCPAVKRIPTSRRATISAIKASYSYTQCALPNPGPKMLKEYNQPRRPRSRSTLQRQQYAQTVDDINGLLTTKFISGVLRPRQTKKQDGGVRGGLKRRANIVASPLEPRPHRVKDKTRIIRLARRIYLAAVLALGFFYCACSAMSSSQARNKEQDIR